MSKKILALLIAVIMVLGMLPITALAVETEEPTKKEEVYQIGTAEQLLWFAQEVNSGNASISAVLTSDIDLSDVKDWPGIGTSSKKFAGNFDGQGHTVTFKDTAVGLFGYIMGSKNVILTVKNTITEGTIKNSGFAMEAGFVHFTNCINRATITYYGSRVAGLVGLVDGVVEAGILKSDVVFTNCGNEASVSSGGGNTAGIVGYTTTNTRLNGCYNTGNIYGYGSIGGLVGYMQEANGTCEIKNSYNTGTITGNNAVGGIIGYMYNGVSISGCYNAGSSFYAIAGARYDQTAKITNSYYLGVASAKCSPDYNVSKRYDENTYEISTRATAVSAAVMASEEFANLMGDAFVQSCPTPVLSWQTAVSHTGDVCENCNLGSAEKEIYDVTFQEHNGYTLSGEDKATQGAAYTFTLTISEGYKTEVDFNVKVNGKAIDANSDGSYTVIGVDGPMSITVVGVQLIPGAYGITLPAEGYGYRTAGDKTVKDGEDYTFTLSFVDGFKAGKNFRVYAQKILSQELIEQGYKPEDYEIDLTNCVENGVYTFANVDDNYKILVSGVDAVSSGVTVTVNFSITEGYNEFHVSPGTETLMIDQTITVPYFDLSLYGLERYYYNPNCYVDENGNLRNQQQVGTPESAYDNITVMHAFIVATEICYYGYDPEDVGKGTPYASDPEGFKKAISWSQGAGSSFMDFWDFGTNLNYYVNYEYPLGYPGWGSTSDQILIENGDVLSVHMITGNASGSRFGFFVVNDADKQFTQNDIVDSYEVNQGEKVDLTLYWTKTTGDYSTGYETIANKGIYWIAAGDEGKDVRFWNATKLGVEPEVDPEDDEPAVGIPVMTTNSKGIVTISTVGVAPGTYYLAAPGGWTEGGAVDNDGFKSAGGETGVSYFKLTVNEYEGKLGDVDGDSIITGADALLVLQYVAKETTEVNESEADVDGDGIVTGADALLILQYVAEIITSFPAEQTD